MLIGTEQAIHKDTSVVSEHREKDKDKPLFSSFCCLRFCPALHPLPAFESFVASSGCQAQSTCSWEEGRRALGLSPK